MKKVLFALLAVIVSMSVVSATTISANDNASVVSTMDDDKVKIKPEELPDAVKTALSAPDYTGWQISNAYKITDQDAYEVELKNGAEVKVVKFDKDGKIMQ
jgi:hypothetical protein